MKNNKVLGREAEKYVERQLSHHDIPFTYLDDWADLMVHTNPPCYLEIKSCDLCIRRGDGKDGYQAGRFDFESKKTRTLLRKHNAWVCFVIRLQPMRYVLLGFCRARRLPDKRHLSLATYRKVRMLTLGEWRAKIDPNDTLELLSNVTDRKF